MNIQPTVNMLAADAGAKQHHATHLLLVSDLVLDVLKEQYGVERKNLTVISGWVRGLWADGKYIPGDVARQAFNLGPFRERLVEYQDPKNPRAMVRTTFVYERGTVELTERDAYKTSSVVEEERVKRGLPAYSHRKIVVLGDRGSLTVYSFGDRRLVVSAVVGIPIRFSEL